MNHRILNPLVLAVLLAAAPVVHADSVIPATSIQVGHLGDGYSARDQRVVTQCAAFKNTDVEWKGLNTSTFDFKISATQDQVESDLGIGAGGRYRTGVTETNASAKFAHNSKSSGYSLSYTWVSLYDFAPLELKKFDFDPGIRAAFNPEIPTWLKLDPKSPTYQEDVWSKANLRIVAPDRFYQSCGDEVVYKQEIHAKLYVNLRVDFMTEQEMTHFSTHVNFSSPTFSANADFDKKDLNISTNTKFTFSALQIGGDNSAITKVFGKENGGFAVVQCTFGDIKQCQAVMQKAIDYASKDFATQIQTKGADAITKIGTTSGPSITASYARDWHEAHLRLLGDLSAQGKELNAATKQELEGEFETIFEQWFRLSRMGEVKIPRLSDTQEQLRAKYEAATYTSLKILKDAIQSCYDRPLDCTTAYEAVQKQTLAKLKPEDFVFEPETLAQYCDSVKANILYVKGQVNPIEPSAGLAATINALTAIAASKSAGVEKSGDVCGAIDDVLSDATELDLSKANLKNLGVAGGVMDLAPLKNMANLRKLNLSGNDFESRDLQLLASFTHLTELDLSDTKVTTVEFLAPLMNLETLRLNEDKLGDLTPLRSLRSIKELDLRNTGEGRACPIEDRPEVCDIIEYASRGQFMHIRDYSPSRHTGHQALAMENGLIRIFGGMNGSANEVYDPQTDALTEMENSKTERLWFTATALGEGSSRALIFGGALPVSSAIVFDANASPQMSFVKVPESASRIFATSSVMGDGRVLIAGGFPSDASGSNGAIAMITTLIFEPTTLQITKGPAMKEARSQHQSIRLDDGRVLITGGVDRNGFVGSEADRVLNSAEIFDGKTFTRLPRRMSSPRFLHQMTKLADGRVLITGGFSDSVDGKLQKPLSTAEIFDPKTNAFDRVEAPMTEERAAHQAVRLSGGQVLILGGATEYSSAFKIDGACDKCSATAELFDPVHNRFIKLGTAMIAPRAFFSVTPIDAGRVLIVGGLGTAASSAEMFSYDF